MIVRSGPASGAGGFLVVRQADHARLAGRIVALARDPALVEHPRRAELLLAVAEHDNGWWEEDAAPRLDRGTGGPTDFRAFPAPERRAVWRRGIDRLAVDSLYAAALVAGHFLRLGAVLGGRDAEEAELLTWLAGRRLELLDAAAAAPEEAERDDRWLQLGDELSLVAATLAADLFRTPGWELQLERRDALVELRLAPFPWAAATRFELEARRLAAHRFGDPVSLGVALARAPREPISIRLAPCDPD